LQEIIRELMALQEREGWLPPEGLSALAARLRIPLHRLESVSTFYTHFRREPASGEEVAVCRDLSCRLAGSEGIREELTRRCARDGGASVREVSCLGRCDRAPAVALGHALVDPLLGPQDPASLEERLRARDHAPDERPMRAWPAADPYASEGEGLAPYAVIREALAGSREAVVGRLEAAGLRGMGGAAFPTARKWSLVAAEPATPKYVICNADESEPGTFKDRELLHDLPHLVIEGLLLAGFSVGATQGTIFIRHEYEPERRRLEAAIAEAREQGALGRGIFGSDFDFDVEIFVSPGGYILGEETALLECLEGRRGEPRNKPPFPGQRGLFGQPTLINNVETLVHSVAIAHRGPEWWAGLGRGDERGHKFLSVSGDVERPGVGLYAFGTPLREILEQHGGIEARAELLAFAPGGASSAFLGPDALDTPLGFEAIAATGSMLGSGALVFVAEGRDLLEVGLAVTRFFRNESCGKCVPCRMGTEKAVSLVEKAGGISEADEVLLRSLAATMGQTSICGLGQVALTPLVSILDRFSDRVRRVAGD
jgi:NADH:ubiquinone oxidoreductase subunit F (NADH-binding)/NADH:ubiquinone oxidoreductase subunit E